MRIVKQLKLALDGMFSRGVAVKLAETKKAILIYIYPTGKKVWIPKSVITFKTYENDILEEYLGRILAISIKKWFASKNGIKTFYPFFKLEEFNSLLEEIGRRPILVEKPEKKKQAKKETVKEKKPRTNEKQHFLLCGKILLDSFEPKYWYERKKFPVWLFNTVECAKKNRVWDDRCGKLVGLKIEKLGRIFETKDKKFYVVEYFSNSPFYDGFVHVSEDAIGKELKTFILRGVDVDEDVSALILERGKNGWKVRFKSFVD